MRILVISKYASPPAFASSSSRLFHLCSEFRKMGNSVLLITSDSNHFTNYPKTKKIYNRGLHNNVSFEWIKTLKYYKTASLLRLLSWFDFEIKLFFSPSVYRFKPEIVIVSSLSLLTILYGIYIKIRFKSFLVFEVRDIWPLTLVEEGGFSKWNPLVLMLGWVEKIGYKYSDLIVGTMPKLDLHVIKILGYSKPFHYSPLGFDPNDYEFQDIYKVNEFRSRYPEGKEIVGYAGSLGLSNGLDPFIDAIKLMSADKQLHFVILGDGDLKNVYKNKLSNCTNVTFLNRVKQSDVKYFLASCDLLYLSTNQSRIWNYGQSMNKIVEYMLSAKPILASYTGYPTMINDSNCGRYFNARLGRKDWI